VLDLIRKQKSYIQMLDDLKVGRKLPGLGLPRSARLPIAVSLLKDMNIPVVLLTDRADRALTMLDELNFWAPEFEKKLFPEPNPLFYEQAAWGSVTRRERLEALTSLALYHLPGSRKPTSPVMVVTSLRAVMTRTLPRRDFLSACKTIKLGQTASPEALQRTWVDLGYESVDTVLEHGQFSRRGGLLDVWTPAEPFPVRIEFFGDEIDTLRQFDPGSQRTIRPLEDLLVTPAREMLPSKSDHVFPEGQDVDEFYIPVVHSAPSTLLDYLPRQTLIMIDNLANLATFGEEIEEQAVKMRAESIREGTIPPDFPIPYVTFSEIEDVIETRRSIELGTSTAPEENPFGAIFTLGERFGGQLKSFLTDLESQVENQNPSMVVTRQISRLKELWGSRAELDASFQPQFKEGTLTEGWNLSLDNGHEFHLITDSEIFGWERPQPRPHVHVSYQAPEASYADLNPGDLVVHVDYGIGRFAGLVRRVLEGTDREFLCVEYEGGDQLYVPIHQADRLSRYVGSEADRPRLSRLGTNEWSQTKQSVRQAVIEVAQDLLELYAKRQSAQGFAFSADSPWQQELEASFPYVETADQLKAINEVKHDMEAPKPMDRLLCGDVGYGKTEVALRAAFKAVMDGKQVAILVPTTVLAQQHYETFRQRLSSYPVTVEMLSRFRNPRQQEEIVLKLALGEVDIVIGTHRLLTSDIVFKDLGLVIIDEEQRFGVTHKEHFKKLRTEVDVLTLTATPIPRTLYMALTGARDISNINTPPAERLPIITHIGPYSPKIVRQAILRELDRGGQIFFVHNRVQTIYAMERHLQAIVPEARIGIGHGQMREDELSSVMTRFTKGEIDVLLCTSIIESGLDIPNANTLIVDRGDTFGLAQLYQLRGRVGRGAQRAYAYFFRHRKKQPTVDGQERLETIAENTQLGSGYSIAMRDLEMRGAGDMLGTRQSGFIASVGFHLYTRMLGQAVRELRKTIPDTREVERTFGLEGGYSPVTVDLPLSVGIPAEYVADQNLRLQLYRRMANLRDEAELDSLVEEFTDRFGQLAEPVSNLVYQIRVKLRGERAGLASVSIEGDQIVLRYPQLPEGVTARDLPPVNPQVRAGRNAYWMSLPAAGPNWQEKLLNVLTAILPA
jgi:transcription-repair coupling factor (superfamily II helicase)